MTDSSNVDAVVEQKYASICAVQSHWIPKIKKDQESLLGSRGFATRPKQQETVPDFTADADAKYFAKNVLFRQLQAWGEESHQEAIKKTLMCAGWHQESP
jgi:hypothetical protein